MFTALEHSNIGVQQFWQHLYEVDRVAQMLWQFCYHWRQYVKANTDGRDSPSSYCQPPRSAARGAVHRPKSTIGGVPTLHEPFWSDAQVKIKQGVCISLPPRKLLLFPRRSIRQLLFNVFFMFESCVPLPNCFDTTRKRTLNPLFIMQAPEDEEFIHAVWMPAVIGF